MCIITGPAQALQHVAGTSILARALPGARQIVVYSMTITANEPVAMVLPVPVPPASGESALRFINLERYPTFFGDLDEAFPAPLAIGGGPDAALGAGTVTFSLEVHDVGAFEASFVPTRADFNRLDGRFRLSDEVWAALPQYDDWGFAVFQLKVAPAQLSWFDKLLGRSPEPKTETVHPMAFEFPVRDPSRLFFPTVHVHDGRVHAEARFDHSLYAQALAGEAIADQSWQPSEGSLGRCVDLDRAGEVLDGALPCFKATRLGMLPNEDTYVASKPGMAPPHGVPPA